MQTGNIDANVSHDRTYFGNGCPGNNSSSATSGIEACSSRMVSTVNDGDQKNGTYYHYQAATDGSGAAIATNNTNSPDTFCPLGWQLPYGGTGGDYYDKSKSLKYLLSTYSIISSSSGSTIIRSYPLSFVRAGTYYWSDGRLFYFNEQGYYGSSTINSDYKYYWMSLWGSGLQEEPHYKYHGSTLRCATS